MDGDRLAVSEHPSSPTTDHIHIYEKLKSLEGEWSGTYAWTGDKSGSGEIYARYYLTGFNSAIVEDLMDENGVVSMTSVYHLDHNDLRMTHYCAANNHPRLKAIVSDAQSVKFEMVDITNLKTGPENHGHVYEVRLEFAGNDRLDIFFSFDQEGKKSLETVNLSRND